MSGLHARPQPSRALAFGVSFAGRPRAGTPRREGHSSRADVTDIDAWFTELDRFAEVPFMDEGRRQPPIPSTEDLFG